MKINFIIFRAVRNIKNLPRELKEVYFKVEDEMMSTNDQPSIKNSNNVVGSVDQLSNAMERTGLNARRTIDHNQHGFDNGNLGFFDNDLSSGQKIAVRFALNREHFAIIQGPPGTGKTTVLVEIIHQLCAQGKRVSKHLLIFLYNRFYFFYYYVTTILFYRFWLVHLQIQLLIICLPKSLNARYLFFGLEIHWE